MSTGNFLTDIEDACIAKILTALRPVPAPPDPLPDHYVAPAPRRWVNKCDVFPGEKDEVFQAIIREVAPAIWLRLDRGQNAPKEFEQATSSGQPMTVGTTQDRSTLVWSFFIAAASLRAPKELSHGGPGVVGAYDLLRMLIGSPQNEPSAPAKSDMQLRGWKPVSYAEPFILVGWGLLGQTTTAAVYELQLRTRVQL